MDIYQNAINTTSKNLKPKPNYNKRNSWFNIECMEAVKKRNVAQMRVIDYPTKENQSKYKQCKEVANKTIRRGKRLSSKKIL